MEINDLVGSEIHGFRTMEDLDFGNMMKEAKTRWLRSNEIHAVLCNPKYFTVYVKPMNLPKNILWPEYRPFHVKAGGMIVLFDRKKLRNFRKDGHNWKKKTDGKTVKEAHEHLKVGDKERIHVYYARGEDNPTFVRRCYWLLDKSSEHIVLVHYRETQEGSPATPGNSNSSSAVSDLSVTWPLLEESDSLTDRAYGCENHKQRLHEINTLDWEELLVPENSNKPITHQEASGQEAGFGPTNQYPINSCKIVDDALETNANSQNPVSLNKIDEDNLETQDSFDRWITGVIGDSSRSVDDQALEPSISAGYNQPSICSTELINVIDVSPSWAFSTEETKILIVVFFNGGQQPHHTNSLNLTCGDSVVPVETVQAGVFRCLIPPQKPGSVNLYLTFDGHDEPISQVLTFEFRDNPILSRSTTMMSLEDQPEWLEFQLQMRLARMLFSPPQIPSVFSSEMSEAASKEANMFSQRTSQISDGWVRLAKMIEDAKMPFPEARDCLFELTLESKLREWLLEKVTTGSKVSELNEQGLGVIHLCAILGYTWAVLPFSCSGLSMDYRDKFGWTALHWAAYHGREKMVAALLSAGSKPNLVTDPTSENPSGHTPADLASKNGYDGLAGYLAEKSLVTQFNDMTLAGNVSGTLQNHSEDTTLNSNTEEELCLKDTLAAYRTAADAAARIHSAFREHLLKVNTMAAEAENSEVEARDMVAAMKIQHAFRRYETRKMMAAALRIQHRFRTWKVRQDFLYVRQHTIRIQAIFRGFHVRKQYRKIIWSVGILEKAVLRWRMKRKGFRGLVGPTVEGDEEGGEGFFRASRKQVEERMERSVVRVQAMFRSRQAQEDYRRMKLEHDKASVEYGLLHSDPDVGMG